MEYFGVKRVNVVGIRTGLAMQNPDNEFRATVSKRMVPQRKTRYLKEAVFL